MILNIGCGEDPYGDIRADIVRTKMTNLICDAERTLPFREEIFELVYAKFLFEHLRSPGQFLSEVKRVLTKAGRIVLITDNAGCIGWNLPQIAIFGIHGWEHDKYHCSANPSDSHYALYLPGHILNHFRVLGFRPLRVRYFWGESSVNLGHFKRFLETLAVRRLKHFILPHILIEAMKEDLRPTFE